MIRKLKAISAIRVLEHPEHGSTSEEGDMAMESDNEEGALESTNNITPLRDQRSPTPTEDRTIEVYRIQVSAKHLILASPVLKNLLTGGWKENMTLLEKGSVEVTAKSWDLEALLNTLRVIHGQTTHVPRKITLEMFAKIAMVVDYYECSEAMGIAADLWRSKFKSFPEAMCRDLVFWMWISWAFRQRKMLNKVTSIAMATAKDKIPHLGFPIPEGIIGKYPAFATVITV
jgi:hypothetical protein